MKENYLQNQLENLSPQEKIALIGEPTKIANTIMKKINPLYKGENEEEHDIFKKTPVELTLIEPIITNQRKIINRIKNCFQKFVISSNNPYKSAWDFLLLILISYNTMIIFYYICFETLTYLAPLDIMIDVFYGLDMILNFFHAYQNPITLKDIDELDKIAKNYLKTWFIVDFLSVFPFNSFISSQTVGLVIKLIRTCRLGRIYKMLSTDQILKVLEAFLQNRSQRERYKFMFEAKNTYKLISLVVSASILTYFLGCFWYLIVSNESSNPKDDNFFNNNYLGQEPYSRRLIICCYFVMTTLSTVGFGDYTPLTNLEKIITIVIMIMGIGLFSYIMGNFNNLASSDNPLKSLNQQNALQKWLTVLTKFMPNGRLPKKLVKKIVKHFDFFWQNDKLLDLTINDEYLTALPKPIRHEIMKYLFEDIFHLFRGFLLIKDHSGSPFYYELAFEFIPVKFEPGKIILSAGADVHEVYLIQAGEIEISFCYEDLKIKRVKGFGYNFGNYQILSGHASEFTYTVITQVKALVLPKHRFLKVLEKYPDLKTHMIDYSFKMAKQTYKAMADSLKVSLFLQKHEEITLKQAEAILKVIIEKFTGNTAEWLARRPSNLIDHDYEETESKLKIFEEQLFNMTSKLENITIFVNERINSLKESVEKVKKDISGQNENYF